MHIAFWSPAWPLENHQNGIITFVHTMKLALEALGHRVSVFTPVRDASVTDPRVYLVQRSAAARLARRAWTSMFPIERDIARFGEVGAAAVLAVHRREPIDVIEMEESFGWAEDIARLTRLPVLVKLHGPAFLSLIEGELESPSGRDRVEREGRALERAVAIASPSLLTLQQTIERYRLTPTFQAHVFNPLDISDRIPRWSAESSDPNHILFVGRFDRRKGADIALRAFRELLRAQPGLKLTFVGPDNGVQEPGGPNVRFAAFRDALFPPELRSQVEYLGRRPNHEVAVLRTQAAVTIVASRWENQGYTALEAMLQGCPVVCSDAGGGPESVKNGLNGLLARSEDAADFALQIETMLADRAAAAALGVAARAHVLENHSASKIALQSVDLYRSIIAWQATRHAVKAA